MVAEDGVEHLRRRKHSLYAATLDPNLGHVEVSRPGDVTLHVLSNRSHVEDSHSLVFPVLGHPGSINQEPVVGIPGRPGREGGPGRRPKYQ